MGIKRPTYHDPVRASINLALPWHSVAEEIADRNFDIVTGKLNKRMKSCNPARLWGPKDFLSGVGHYTHSLEGYVLKPESLVILSKPPPTEQTAEDQPFLAWLVAKLIEYWLGYGSFLHTFIPTFTS